MFRREAEEPISRSRPNSVLIPFPNETEDFSFPPRCHSIDSKPIRIHTHSHRGHRRGHHHRGQKSCSATLPSSPEGSVTSSSWTDDFKIRRCSSEESESESGLPLALPDKKKKKSPRSLPKFLRNSFIRLWRKSESPSSLETEENEENDDNEEEDEDNDENDRFPEIYDKIPMTPSTREFLEESKDLPIIPFFYPACYLTIGKRKSEAQVDQVDAGGSPDKVSNLSEKQKEKETIKTPGTLESILNEAQRELDSGHSQSSSNIFISKKTCLRNSSFWKRQRSPKIDLEFSNLNFSFPDTESSSSISESRSPPYLKMK